ncbi:MAG: rod-binding protein [Rubellimicrobium sp.]|nr:rod-binding protein [Rubellimicrobium sp.]
MIDSLPATPPHPPDEAAQGRLRDAAMRLEALFLAEMLKSARPQTADGTFGGGIGEEQFTSFLIDAQAGEMARAGGVGLAETLFRAMSNAADAA